MCNNVEKFCNYAISFTDFTIFMTLGFNIILIKLEFTEGKRNVCIIHILNESQDWSIIGEVYDMEKADKQPRVM
jgi:hypothetical protein